MPKLSFTSILFCVLLFNEASAQSSTVTVVPVDTYKYHPRTEDKLSWQRLNLLLSTSHTEMSTARQTCDSSLLLNSRSLGLSRLPVAAQGIDDPKLFAESTWFDKDDPDEGIRLLSKAKGKKHLQLLIILCSYYIFQPIPYADISELLIKSAIKESKTTNEKELGRVALCLLTKLYSLLGDKVQCDSVFTVLEKECEAAGDKITLGRALTWRGIYGSLPVGSTPDQASVDALLPEKIAHLKRAAAIYHELNDAEGEIVALTYGGYFSLHQSRLDEAYQAFIKALQLQKDIGYPYTHYTTDNIAMTTTTQGKFGEPLKYSLETVRTAEKTKDSIGWAQFYNRLGGLYHTDGDRKEEALKWLLKSLDRYVMAKDPSLYNGLYSIVGILNESPGREEEALNLVLNISEKTPPIDSTDRIFYHITLANAYMGIKDYRLAERHVFSADSILRLARFESFNSAFDRFMINYTLATIYFKEGQLAKSKKYFELYLADSSRARTLNGDMAVYETLITIDSAFNDPVSVMNHYRQYKLLLDSNFRMSKIRQAEELQVIYQTQEKETEIALLNQQSKLEKANLKQATLVKNLTIAGIIAVLIIAGLLYRQNRLKQKNNNIVTHKNKQLQHYLDEKEWLLKEIHHRVKNNLQIVMSLLNSQSAYIDNEPALTAIHDSQHRVHAMSLIHQKLYNSENLSSIDISLYIRELVSYLRDSFNTGQRIRFELAIESIDMDVSQAIPLGLILNEAITNSIKYAFPGNGDGIISISLSKTSAHECLLTISDNGIGIPQHLGNKKPGSLGMSLMTGLSEDLEGRLSIDNNNGTAISVLFPHDTVIKRQDVLNATLVSNN